MWSVPLFRQCGKEFQAYGIRPPGLRIRGNDAELETGSYIILLDEVPLILGKVQKNKLFVSQTVEGLEKLGIVGQKSWSSPWMYEGCWVSPEDKERLTITVSAFGKTLLNT
jgi:type III secretory pathway component EscV